MKNIVLSAVMLGLLCLLGLPPQSLHAQSPFSFEGTYIAEFYGNAAGGLDTGVGFMGMGNLKMEFDTRKARWWRGGSLLVNGATTHGKSLSENYLGDLQIASNIDAGTHIYLHEFWFRQAVGQLSFTVGLQDLNAQFMASDNASEYINSSFGVPPVISANIPVPIFPLTGLGISARWDTGGWLALQAAVFDGDQTPFEDNPHNVHWSFDKGDGVLAMTELHARLRVGGKAGTWKAGSYYHSADRNYGFYLLADQTVVERGTRRFDLFAQLAAAPENKNDHTLYLGLGANLHGVFSRRGHDVAGIALAAVDMHRAAHKRETTMELFYKYRLSDNFTVQPDIQYVINPSGTDTHLKNAVTGLLRVSVEF